MTDNVLFLGYIIDRDDISMDESKVQVVAKTV